jgi:hypothetical protein
MTTLRGRSRQHAFACPRGRYCTTAANVHLEDTVGTRLRCFECRTVFIKNAERQYVREPLEKPADSRA